MGESKVPPEAIPGALAELEQAGFAYYEDCVLWVRTRVKHMRSRSPAIAKSIANDLLRLPDNHPLRVRFLAEYGDVSWLRDELRRTSREGLERVPENPKKKGNQQTLPGPSREGPGQGEGQGQGQRKNRREPDTGEPPSDFPAELRPHFAQVRRVLVDLAERHGSRAVVSRSLASVMAEPSRRRKAFVKAAHDFVSWADTQPELRKDVIAGYRNWLEKVSDLAAIERVAEPGEKGNVVPISKFAIYDEAAGL
jgi:hypothetical protein